MRSEQQGWRVVALLLSAAGILLQVTMSVAYKADPLVAIGLSIPYGVCLLFAWLVRNPWPSVGAALALLIVDATFHYSTFIAPQGSTDALAILYWPYVNLFAVLPVAMVISWALSGVLQRKRAPRPKT